MPALLVTVLSGISAAGDVVILGEGSYWRVFMAAKTPAARVREGAALKSGSGSLENLAERLYATAAEVADTLRK